MKAEQFSESFNNINEKYLDEAMTYNVQQAAVTSAEGNARSQAGAPSKASKPFRTMKVWRAVAIAACALLVVGVTATAVGLSTGRKGAATGAADSYYYEGEAEGRDGAYYEDSYNAQEAGEYEEGFYDTGEYDAAVPAAGAESGENLKDGGTDGFTTMVPQGEDAKIIYTAYMNVDTTDFEQSQSQIENITKNHNGYFESMDQGNNSSSYRHAYYKVRIPADEFDAFIKDAEGFGTITSFNQNADDVSEYYYDTESRLETAKSKLQRLQELLSQAQDITDIITIENEIADVQLEIDDLSGTLKSYDSQVAYSTVSIDLYEVYRISDGDTALTFSERISQAFKKGLRAFSDGMEELLIWFAANWIWILIIAIVIAAAIIIPVKCTGKSRKGGKEKKGNNKKNSG